MLFRSGKIIPAGTGMKKYRDIVPDEVGSVSNSVYSISDVEKSLDQESALATPAKDEE